MIPFFPQNDGYMYSLLFSSMLEHLFWGTTLLFSVPFRSRLNVFSMGIMWFKFG